MITYIIIVVGYLFNLISLKNLAEDDFSPKKSMRIFSFCSLIIPYLTWLLMVYYILYNGSLDIIEWINKGK